MSKYSGYDVRERSKCYKRECFVPFSGNGRKTCRLYELGQCPEKYRTTKKEMTSFAEFYLEEQNLSEMPHVSTDEFSFDFKMEKPGWPGRMVKFVHVVGKDKVEELLSPFYGIYGQMFKVKFNKITEEEKNLLRSKLPKQFLSDMGVE